MDTKELQLITEDIINHAQYGTTPDGQRIRNELSPSLGNFTFQLVRGFLIRTDKQAVLDIQKELGDLKNLTPEASQAQIDLALARVVKIINETYKGE